MSGCPCSSYDVFPIITLRIAEGNSPFPTTAFVVRIFLSLDTVRMNHTLTLLCCLFQRNHTYGKIYRPFLLLKQSANSCDLCSKSTFEICSFLKRRFFCPTNQLTLGQSTNSRLLLENFPPSQENLLIHTKIANPSCKLR